MSLITCIDLSNQSGNLIIDGSNLSVVVCQFKLGKSVGDGLETGTEGINVCLTISVCRFLCSFCHSPLVNDIVDLTFYTIKCIRVVWKD